MQKANDMQVGGSHYAAAYQHWDLVEDWGVGYLEGCATKYLTRWRKKNGVQDLEKALHYATKLLEIATDTTNRMRARANRGRVGGEALDRFLVSNEVGEVESLIITDLLNWSDPQHIGRAIASLKELINVARSETASA